MKRAEALRIIKSEHLVSYCFFEDRSDPSDEMVIRKEADHWVVYATNERGAKISGGEKKFDNEEAALDSFIRRLRALNNYLNS